MSEPYTWRPPLELEDLKMSSNELALPLQDPAVLKVALLRQALGIQESQIEGLQIDSKSGLLNQAGWTEFANNILTGISGAILIQFDAEGFKAINDEYGHLEGDRRIRMIGDYLKTVSRIDENDILGRPGGDEFAWLIVYDKQETTPEDVLNSVELRLRDTLHEEKFPDMPKLRWHHAFFETGETLQSLMKRADTKGENKPKCRSQSQGQEAYEAAVALSRR
jgi:diguanylate cyclase (GGDEF)-like protein